MPDEQYKKFMEEISNLHKRMTEHYQKEDAFKDEVREKLNPIYDLFIQTKGFNNVLKWILVSLAKTGVAVGVIYSFLKWLKTGHI